MNDTLTQNQAILAYLEQGHSLTPLDALDRFGCNRLAARCWELKLAGWEIEKTTAKLASGKRVASYRLKTEPERASRVILGVDLGRSGTGDYSCRIEGKWNQDGTMEISNIEYF